MKEKIAQIVECLQTMSNCLKFPKVENCICFYQAFMILNREIQECIDSGVKDREVVDRFNKAKDAINQICNGFNKEPKKCFGCSPCLAHEVFEKYPDHLNALYMEDKI